VSPRVRKDSLHPRLQSGPSVRPLSSTVRSHGVRAAVVIGGLVVILMLDVIASWRILRSEVHSRAQKLAWLLLIWLAPLLGSILALQISTERIVPAPVARSFEQGPDLSPDIGGSGSI
jgi:Phospholipase_D-nuclease N-terminal